MKEVMIMKIKYEALRYLASMAKYSKDEVSESILKALTFDKRGKSYQVLLNSPYKRNADNTWVCCGLSGLMDMYAGDDWYKFTVDEDGRKYLLESIISFGTEKRIPPVTEHCKELDGVFLSIFRVQSHVLESEVNK